MNDHRKLQKKKTFIESYGEPCMNAADYALSNNYFSKNLNKYAHKLSGGKAIDRFRKILTTKEIEDLFRELN